MHRVPSASTERPGVEDVAAATLSLSTPAKMFVGSNDAGDTRHRLPRSLAASSDFPGQERANATTYSDAAATSATDGLKERRSSKRGRREVGPRVSQHDLGLKGLGFRV
jgi:hypothetical protein